MFYTTKQLYTPPLEPYELNGRALVVDTETVGAGPTVEIIEIALGDAEGRILFESLVRPAFNRLPPPSKHHRFERVEFEAAPDWAEVWAEVSRLIDGRLLVAYNAAFDRRALSATCSRYRQEPPERGWRCVMPLVKAAMGTRKNPTLEAACAHFGVEGGNHRAGRDVEATCRLLREVLARGAGGAAR